MSASAGTVSFGDHALEMLAERGIERAWVERTLSDPEAVEEDPRHAGRLRAFRTVPERGGRVWRVVYVRSRYAPRDHLLPGSRTKAMKTSHDAQADLLYVRFADAAVVESEGVRPGIVFDFDAEGRIVAVEILDASEHLASGADLRTLSAA